MMLDRIKRQIAEARVFLTFVWLTLKRWFKDFKTPSRWRSIRMIGVIIFALVTASVIADSPIQTDRHVYLQRLADQTVAPWASDLDFLQSTDLDELTNNNETPDEETLRRYEIAIETASARSHLVTATALSDMREQLLVLDTRTPELIGVAILLACWWLLAGGIISRLERNQETNSN